MKSLKKPANLIKEISSSAYQSGQNDQLIKNLKNPRNLTLTMILCLLVGLLSYRLYSRKSVELLFSRQSQAVYSQLENGQYANLFTVNAFNTTHRDLDIEFISLDKDIEIICSGCPELNKFEEKNFSLMILTSNKNMRHAHIQIQPTLEVVKVPLILPRS